MTDRTVLPLSDSPAIGGAWWLPKIRTEVNRKQKNSCWEQEKQNEKKGWRDSEHRNAGDIQSGRASCLPFHEQCVYNKNHAKDFA